MLSVTGNEMKTSLIVTIWKTVVNWLSWSHEEVVTSVSWYRKMLKFIVASVLRSIRSFVSEYCRSPFWGSSARRTMMQWSGKPAQFLLSPPPVPIYENVEIGGIWLEKKLGESKYSGSSSWIIISVEKLVRWGTGLGFLAGGITHPPSTRHSRALCPHFAVVRNQIGKPQFF